MNKYPPVVQRPRLLEFAAALGCRDDTLRRDECGDWRINGRYGWIYAAPGPLGREEEGWQIFYLGLEAFNPYAPAPITEYNKQSNVVNNRGKIKHYNAHLKRLGTYTEKALSPFAELLLSCEGENVWFINRLPTKIEAEILRDRLGVAKKREVSEDTLSLLRAHGAEHRFTSPKPTLDSSDEQSGTPTPTEIIRHPIRGSGTQPE